MERIEAETVASVVRKPWYGYLGQIFAIVGLVCAVVLFFLTSDIAILSWLPGKEFFTENLLPYFRYFMDSMSFLARDEKGISIPAMILAAAVLFFVIDLVLRRNKAVGTQ
jgi:hypothetical protein